MSTVVLCSKYKHRCTHTYTHVHSCNISHWVQEKQALFCTINLWIPTFASGCGADHHSYLVTVKGALAQPFCPGHIWHHQRWLRGCTLNFKGGSKKLDIWSYSTMHTWQTGLREHWEMKITWEFWPSAKFSPIIFIDVAFKQLFLSFMTKNVRMSSVLDL